MPDPVITFVQASEYAAGLPVVDIQRDEDHGNERHEVDSDPVIVAVSGSGSDFEYQLPASPKFFVGRKNAIQSYAAEVGRRLRGWRVMRRIPQQQTVERVVVVLAAERGAVALDLTRLRRLVWAVGALLSELVDAARPPSRGPRPPSRGQ